MTSVFLNRFFPSDICHPPVSDYLYFDTCHFQQGQVIVPSVGVYYFVNCRFHTGTTLMMCNPSAHVLFDYCIFDLGCDIHLDCHSVSFKLTQFPLGHMVFSGPQLGFVSIDRLSRDQSLVGLPPCRRLCISDGLGEDGENWELTEPFRDLPKNKVCYLNFHPSLREGKTMDCLVETIWRNPNFIVGRLNWKGNPKDRILFDKANRMSPRRCLFPILALLLVGLKMPSDLIREVCTYLV